MRVGVFMCLLSGVFCTEYVFEHSPPSQSEFEEATVAGPSAVLEG